MLTRRGFLAASAAAAGLSVFGFDPWIPGAGEARAATSDLEIFGQGYPRAFLFLRQLEDGVQSGDLPYEEWGKSFLPLNGIMGKVLSEERAFSGTDHLPYFRRYKAENPGKLVLLYYSGRGRGATNDVTAEFFAGHWLYYRGTRLTRAVGASRSETELRVKDTSVFKVGRYAGGPPDDIAVAPPGRDGKPDWARAEQVKLKAIKDRKQITVERRAYGDQLLSFPVGSYLAAHVMTGAYPHDDNLEEDVSFWSYNFATVGPRDARGRTGGEAFADYLIKKLGPGGALSFSDGISFDALEFVAAGIPREEIDADADGKADGGIAGGIAGGVNAYGQGVLKFTFDLRRGLPDKLILADCTFPDTLQRSFTHLNGVESEGYPDLFDLNLENLSKGANVFNFWKENNASPSLNYASFKYRQKTPPADRNTFEEPNLSQDHSYRKLRLVLASSLFSDAAFTYPPDWAPPKTLWRQGNVRVQVFDELWKGEEQEPNWLGQPLGSAVLLAGETSDILRGQGASWPQSFVMRFVGGGTTALSRTKNATSMSVKPTRKSSAPVLQRKLSATLPGIQVPKEALFVSLQLTASPLKGYSASVARRVFVTAKRGSSNRRSFTWANGKPFTATFYFEDIGPGSVDLGFEIEGDAPARLLRLTAHSAADACYREFENGAVFANPSTRPYIFDLNQLFPDDSFRRLQGTANQDPGTNNGQPLGATLTLKPKDALLVVRDQ